MDKSIVSPFFDSRSMMLMMTTNKVYVGHSLPFADHFRHCPKLTP